MIKNAIIKTELFGQVIGYKHFTSVHDIILLLTLKAWISRLIIIIALD